ncbi:hypothetical protein D9V37_08350 [Nocardioides mangrovicus]|uniref:Fis family transcriptional regulator n=1 Tax=Nocardioides mangrovicus TaxID=2478913 RepID=A0A3L8P3P7_9ACTN|nr:hypothetical protein [Nocardioides mangrovicus]RLV49885.1 hypothetical protein D9V37_08350 [Nocardioides mangrovicus]
MTSGSGWLLGVLDDLEQQAEGLALVERDLEVADRARAEYAEVPLLARVHAVVDRPVRLTLLGGLRLEGTVTRTGADWLLLADPAGQEWVVPVPAVAVLRGAPARAVPASAVGVLRRLSLRAVLRRLADQSAVCVLHLVDGATLEGRLLRLGEDFAELRLAGDVGPEGYDVVPLVVVAAARFR